MNNPAYAPAPPPGGAPAAAAPAQAAATAAMGRGHALPPQSQAAHAAPAGPVSRQQQHHHHHHHQQQQQRHHQQQQQQQQHQLQQQQQQQQYQPQQHQQHQPHQPQQQQATTAIPGHAPPGNSTAYQANMLAAHQQQEAVATAVAAAGNLATAPAPPASAGTGAGVALHSLPCTRCGFPNCDVRILGCNCLLHVRCTPVPMRACPNPRCFNSDPAASGGGAGLELLPMEFADLDEARRVADLAAKASWRAKEKSRARKKAKLDNHGGSGPGGGAAAGLAAEEGGKDGARLSTPPPPATSTFSDLRTGRWTAEETAHCDKLIQKFMAGRLPLAEGIKLNEFLSSMHKSKQSRLTKKMKNAKLSSKTFKRTSGYLTDVLEARDFSECEDSFFHSLQNGLERAEIKFHMQKEWRETFSTYCVSHGQPLNVDKWLASVEEMERRVHRAKDRERMHRRKMMMGCALRQDMQNPDKGVVIEKGDGEVPGDASTGLDAALTGQARNLSPGAALPGAVPDPMVSAPPAGAAPPSSFSPPPDHGLSAPSTASPYLHKIMAYVQRHHIPFEYVDAWVPSFVPGAAGGEEEAPSSGVGGNDGGGEKAPKCRLCFGGSIVATQVVLRDSTATSFGPGQRPRRAAPLSPDDQFNLAAFGDYSESFSFDVGCGLPGRVYHMGVPTWEQSVHNAPLHHFERVGGSVQWGIRTVVGIPVPSPNVGRIVVVLYSRHDRAKDHELVIRLTEEFSRLMPSPKWKLVVDVGRPAAPLAKPGDGQPQQQQQQQQQQTMQQDQQPQPQHQSIDVQPQQQQTNINGGAPLPADPAVLTSEVISIFGEHMPSDPSSPAFAYLQGFMSLRLLLLRPSPSNDREQELVNTILSSYSSYKAGGRTRPDIALMLARDFMFLNQQPQKQLQQQTHQVQMQVMQQQQQQQQLLVPNNSQPQYAQQPFTSVQSQIQQQQQQNRQSQPSQTTAVFTSTNSNITSNRPPSMMNLLPPSSSPQYGPLSENTSNSDFKADNTGYNPSQNGMSLLTPPQQQQREQNQQQQQRQGQPPPMQQQQQYLHHELGQQQQPQLMQQQQEPFLKDETHSHLMALGDTSPQDIIMASNGAAAASDQGKDPPLPQPASSTKS